MGSRHIGVRRSERMARRLVVSLVLAATVVAVLPGTSWADPGNTGGGRGRGATVAGADHQPGVLVVGYRGGVDAQQMGQVENGHGVSLAKRLGSINVDIVRLPGGVDDAGAVRRLQQDPAVAFVEYDHVARADAVPVPNDPLYPLQYGPQKMQAEAAHGVAYPGGYPMYTGGNPTTITHPLVAVIDTGIAGASGDPSASPDLVHKVSAVAADCTLTSPSTTGPCPTSAPYDDYGHGTHVAGIAAAETNNAFGMVGVAPGAQLVSIKALDSSGSGYYSWIASGVLCAANLASCGLGSGRADVINMSLGGSSGSAMLQAAIDAARAAGVVVVASAGNSATTALSYPGAYADLSVIATDSTDRVASFSNYGGYANQVSAPGVDILSTVSTNVDSVPIADPSGFAYLSGTSMAAPHVAGVAALLAGQGAPSATIVTNIKTTADPLPSATLPDPLHFGAGRVNAFRAISSLAPAGPPVAPTNLVATARLGSSSVIDLSWAAPAGASSYQVERSLNGATGWVIVGTPATASLASTGLTPSTTYWYRVLARNAIGPSGYSSLAFAITNPPPPLPPGALSATAVSPSAINLSWVASAGASSYQVERSLNGATGWSIVGTPATPGFANTGLSSNTTYWYRVSALNAGGTSGYSNLASATTLVGPPPAPTNLSATAVSPNAINLSWVASAGASSYQVERSLNGVTGWVVVGTPLTASFANTGLTPGVTYWYRVLARNAIGPSGYSNVAFATTTISLCSGSDGEC